MKLIKNLQVAVGFALLVIAGMSFTPSVAQAVPAQCSAANNFCVVARPTPWQWHVYHNNGSGPSQGPFFSEQDAINEAIAYLTPGACSVTPRTPLVTYDDGYGFGASPQYVGSED